MRPPLRIAILECDTPLAATLKRYGGYGGVFKELLNSGNEALAQTMDTQPVELDITTWDVVNEERYPNLEDIDAVLMTGSRKLHFSHLLSRL